MLFKLRERVALLLAPWLEPEPATEEHPVVPWVVTTSTTASGAHAFWKQTG